MSLAKIIVSGKVTKNPEKRFTQNNLPITTFVMDINPADETLVRVTGLGALAENIENSIKAGDNVLIEGKPQIDVAQDTNGKDKRFVEIQASSVEKIGALEVLSAIPVSKPAQKEEDIVKFSTQEAAETLIDEDEIPF